MSWDFFQRYDESWIWRRADRNQVTESSRNFAKYEECVEDAARHGYIPAGVRARKRGAATRNSGENQKIRLRAGN